MPGPHATPPHRTRGSWTPRFAGIGVVVVLAGGALAFYLASAHSQTPVVAPTHHTTPPLVSRVASVQTVGLVGFGVYDDSDPWQNDSDDHPLMLLGHDSMISFVRIPQRQIVSGTPEWTADQLTDGGDTFIYVPTGQCLTASGGGKLSLSHCDLATDQRWRDVDSEVLRAEPIAQYANVSTGRCLTAPRNPGPALMTTCASPHTPHTKWFKSQEIAFWWSA